MESEAHKPLARLAKKSRSYHELLFKGIVIFMELIQLYRDLHVVGTVGRKDNLSYILNLELIDSEQSCHGSKLCPPQDITKIL